MFTCTLNKNKFQFYRVPPIKKIFNVHMFISSLRLFPQVHFLCANSFFVQVVAVIYNCSKYSKFHAIGC